MIGKGVKSHYSDNTGCSRVASDVIVMLTVNLAAEIAHETLRRPSKNLTYGGQILHNNSIAYSICLLEIFMMNRSHVIHALRLEILLKDHDDVVHAKWMPG